MLPALFVVLYIGRIFQIPETASVTDIQMLFFFIFLNFLISIVTSVFSVASYSKDRLELSSISTILGELTRLAGACLRTRGYEGSLRMHATLRGRTCLKLRLVMPKGRREGQP